MTDYPLIRVWGVMFGSSWAYVEMEVEVARRDNAPQDAIYCTESCEPGRRRFYAGDVVWSLWDRYAPVLTRDHMLRVAERMGLEPEVRAIIVNAESMPIN